MKFKVEYCDKLDVRVPNDHAYTLITGTPVILRLDNRDGKYDGYGSKKGHRNPIYWTTDYPIDVFIKQLENNLTRKYESYFELDVQRREGEKPIFNKFKFRKQKSTRLRKGDQMQVPVIGTTWEFMFEEADPLIQFALDTGLGELNSLGFGFMNLKYN